LKTGQYGQTYKSNFSVKETTEYYHLLLNTLYVTNL